MKVSQNGVRLIKEFEGCYLNAYKDPVGVWTIGYGITNYDKAITNTTIRAGLRITQKTADTWLEKALNTKYIKLVMKYDTKYRWNQNELDALVSFAYNIGSIDQLTKNGTRTKKEIADHIEAYNKAGGKVLRGLVRRRAAEKELFLKPCDVYLAVTANTALNMREKAGLMYPVIAVAKHGEKVLFMGTIKKVDGIEWYKVKRNGIKGWMSGKYLKME